MNQINSQPPASSGDKQQLRLGRRALLSVSAAAGGGMMLGLGLLRPGSAAAAASTTINTWVVINPDNTVQIWIPAAEMGQGISSGLAQCLAEELPLDWTKVHVKSTPFGKQYATPYGQITGGSFSTRTWFDPMRHAGAVVREMLRAAAAANWSVQPATLTFGPGNTIVNPNAPAPGNTTTFAAVAAAAAALPVANFANATVNSANGKFRMIGRALGRPDIPSKTNGAAVFGCDVKVPGMVFASIQPAPVYGATVKTMPAVPAGALGIVNCGDAVAVIASNTWTAIQLARSLKTSWNMPANVGAISSSAAAAQAQSLLSQPGVPASSDAVGDPDAAISGAKTTLTLTYTTPFLAHGAMETVNCTALVTATHATIWAPTQAPDWVANTCAAITKLPLSSITVNTTLLGGAAGRKIEQDYIAHAIKAAQAYGKPVKLTWSREADFTHDWYRPLTAARITAGLDASGNILGWKHRVVAGSVSDEHFPQAVVGGYDPSALDGALGSSGLDYAMGARLVDYHMLVTPIPIGWWRSVGHSYNCFAVESAIDECAHAVGMDPLAYRQKLLAGKARHLSVLNAAAKLAGWGTTTLPAGTARGIAFSDGFGSLVALVVELTSTVTGTSTSYAVTKAYCAIDCGTVVNPNQIEAQAQGGLAHGLAAALWGGMGISNGIAQKANFDNYRMLRLRDMPVVQTTIVKTPGAPVGGMGEAMVPPVAPAVANAYFALTGTRKRSLPLFGSVGA